MKNEVFIDTDILTDYLTHRTEGPSLLRHLVSFSVCYTSVLNATELLAAASNDDERKTITDCLCGVHVLGFHQRYAMTFGQIFSNQRENKNVVSLRSSMIAGMCITSKLPLVTFATEMYAKIPGIYCIPVNVLFSTRRWEEVETFVNNDLNASRLN